VSRTLLVCTGKRAVCVRALDGNVTRILTRHAKLYARRRDRDGTIYDVYIVNDNSHVCDRQYIISLSRRRCLLTSVLSQNTQSTRIIFTAKRYYYSSNNTITDIVIIAITINRNDGASQR